MRRTLVIGLDGMEKTSLERLAASGTMPYTDRLLREGTLVALRAPVPEISATSWATFLTGVNPGRHGIFGFVDLQPHSYSQYFPNLDHVNSPLLWDFASAAGLRTLCLNVPSTYPARRINGVLVSGFVAPDPDRAFYPPRLQERFSALDYELDVDVGNAEGDPHGFLGRLRRCLDGRRRAFELALKEERWDLAILVITETDRLQHYLWRDLEDESSPLHADVLDFYRRVDGVLEAIVNAVDESVAVFLVSDHGFARVRHTLYINAWLRQRGYLCLPVEAESLNSLDRRTSAFALDPARIYLNRSDRFPCGGVNPNSAEALCRCLREELLAWHIPGSNEAVFAEVLTSQEAYQGGCIAHAPDLIAVPKPGIFVRGSYRHVAIEGHDAFTGAHTRDNGIFFARSSTIISTAVDMTDVAPTVLSILGISGEQFNGINQCI